MSVSELWLEIYPQLFAALWATLKLASLALAVGLSWGLVIAVMRTSSVALLQRFASAYVEVFRGTPALIQLFIMYFGLAAIGLKFSSFQAAVLGLGFNAAAYLAEIYRAGIQAVPRGQTEAAQAIGMTRFQILRWIVLPQAIRMVLAPIGNVVVNLLKDTSVASLISAPDLMLRAQDLSSEYFMPFTIYMIVGAMYFLICYPISVHIHWAERRSPTYS